MRQKPYTRPQKTTHQKAGEQPDRRRKNRRNSKCDGYTYIPMVGWYCRRAGKRRDNDDLSSMR